MSHTREFIISIYKDNLLDNKKIKIKPKLIMRWNELNLNSTNYILLSLLYQTDPLIILMNNTINFDPLILILKYKDKLPWHHYIKKNILFKGVGLNFKQICFPSQMLRLEHNQYSIKFRFLFKCLWLEDNLVLKNIKINPKMVLEY